MSLEKVYGLSSATVKKLVDNGRMSYCAVRDHEIYDEYLAHRIKNPSKNLYEIYDDLGDHFRVSACTIRKAIDKVDKEL